MSLSVSTRSIMVRFLFIPLEHTTMMATRATRAAPPAAEPAMMPVLLDLAGRLPRDVAVGVGLPEDVAVGARFPEDWTGVPGKFSRSIVCYRAADKIWS